MSKTKKGDVIKCIGALGHCFTTGCKYIVEKVDWQGYVYTYNDEGNLAAIDYPVCPTCGTFKKVD